MTHTSPLHNEALFSHRMFGHRCTWIIHQAVMLAPARDTDKEKRHLAMFLCFKMPWNHCSVTGDSIRKKYKWFFRRSFPWCVFEWLDTVKSWNQVLSGKETAQESTQLWWKVHSIKWQKSSQLLLSWHHLPSPKALCSAKPYTTTKKAHDKADRKHFFKTCGTLWWDHSPNYDLNKIPRNAPLTLVYGITRHPNLPLMSQDLIIAPRNEFYKELKRLIHIE